MDPLEQEQPSANGQIKNPILRMQVGPTEKKRLNHGRAERKDNIATQRAEYPRLGFEKTGWDGLSPRESRT